MFLLPVFHETMATRASPVSRPALSSTNCANDVSRVQCEAVLLWIYGYDTFVNKFLDSDSVILARRNF